MNAIKLKFSTLYLLGLFLIGLAYILIIPAFEGFDETAHFSSVRQIAFTHTIPIYEKSFIDQKIASYSGPVPYGTGELPFDKNLTYKKFFSSQELVDNYKNQNTGNSEGDNFTASNQPNWQSQHPPLYYFLMSPVVKLTENFPLSSQVFIIRIVSYVLVILGVALGLGAVFKGNMISELPQALIGFWIYPIILPMFFIEFARIGNDSLCIFIVGLLCYQISSKPFHQWTRFRSIGIGVTLGLGLLTKAFFLPITAAFGIFYMTQLFLEYKKSKSATKEFINLLIIFLTLFLVGGGWYIYKYITFGSITGSDDAIQIAYKGGIFVGVLEHFSFEGLGRGMFFWFPTYSWGGTWSIVRLPMTIQIPALLIAAIIFIFFGRKLLKQPLTSYLWLPPLVFAFFYFGFFWHTLVTMALGVAVASPGWYLHILMPWMAIAIGVGFFDILKSKMGKLLGILMLSYGIFYQLVGLWFSITLFAGCSTKGANKYFQFDSSFFCINQIDAISNNLQVLGFPRLAAFSFILGVVFFVWSGRILLNQIRSKKLASL